MIRVLAVRQPWASLIVEGLKTIEVRSRDSKIGKVAVYASKGKYKENEINDIIGNFYLLTDVGKIPTKVYEFASQSIYHAPRGCIVGTVDISSTQTCLNKQMFEALETKHLAPCNYFNSKHNGLWYLKNPMKFADPISYKPPKGAVIWSKTELPEGYE